MPNTNLFQWRLWYRVHQPPGQQGQTYYNTCMYEISKGSLHDIRACCLEAPGLICGRCGAEMAYHVGVHCVFGPLTYRTARPELISSMWPSVEHMQKELARVLRVIKGDPRLDRDHPVHSE